MLNAKANPNSVNGNYDVTPTLIVAQKGQYNNLKMLLDYDGLVNITDNRCNTILHYSLMGANQYGSLAINPDQFKIVTKVLNDSTVNVNARNSLNLTALENSVYSISLRPTLLFQTFEYLVDNGAVFDETYKFLLLLNSMMCPYAIRQSIMQKDFNKYVDKINWTDADLYQRHNNGETLLHVAVLNSCKLGVKYLLQQNFDISLKDNNGRTAMHYLHKVSYSERNEISRILDTQ